MDRLRKILLIVENPAEYEAIVQLLAPIQPVHCELVWVDQLSRALGAVIATDADVILLDYHWRVGNCTDLLLRARAQGCRAPIIVMTHEMEAEVDRSAIQQGASDYLIKGYIDSQLLERTLRYAIERKAAEQRLADLAHYDPLTGIANRILFRAKLEHAVSMARRERSEFTLMYLDLDGFKQINDRLGHDSGDRVLQVCASRLRDCLRSSDSVARMGGDEFTLLLENTDSTTGIAHLAQKVIDAIEAPIPIGPTQVSVGCSIGIAVFPEGGVDVDGLLKHADLAMYQAKARRGSHYHFFTDELNTRARRQLLLECELRRALTHKEFTLWYQPRFDLASGQLMGVEALLRWRHPECGVMYPEDFLDVAEATGLIVPIGYWVMQNAARALAQLQQRLTRSATAEVNERFTMTINLSGRQLHDEQLEARVAELIKAENIDPRRIEFELTEAALMEKPERTEACLQALSRLGIGFAVDDFGTGYFSFIHLQRLPIRALKLDHSLVSKLGEDAQHTQLVASIATLARGLDKIIIAEGVETDRQLAVLQQLGCHQAQGNYYREACDFVTLTEKIFCESNPRIESGMTP